MTGGTDMNNLREVPVGGKAKVVRIHGEGAVKRRIMDIKTPRLIQFNYSSADFAA